MQEHKGRTLHQNQSLYSRSLNYCSLFFVIFVISCQLIIFSILVPTCLLYKLSIRLSFVLWLWYKLNVIKQHIHRGTTPGTWNAVALTPPLYTQRSPRSGGSWLTQGHKATKRSLHTQVSLAAPRHSLEPQWNCQGNGFRMITYPFNFTRQIYLNLSPYNKRFQAAFIITILRTS